MATSSALTTEERQQFLEDLATQFKVNVESELVRKIDKRDEEVEVEDDLRDEDASMFLAVKDYLDERLAATGKGSTPLDEVLRLTGAECVPLPLDFTNLAVALDSRWWLIVWEEAQLCWEDLSSKFKKRADGGRLRREFSTALKDALTLEVDAPLSKEAEEAADRLVDMHITLAVHWLHSESSLSVPAFLLRWDSIVHMCQRDATCVYHDYCERCGVSGVDFTVGQKLARNKVPAYLQSGVEMAVKSAMYGRGRKENPSKTRRVEDKPSREKRKIVFDPRAHKVVRDAKGQEWFHATRPDGSAGRRLGKK
jgi:hypothetical protein